MTSLTALPERRFSRTAEVFASTRPTSWVTRFITAQKATYSGESRMNPLRSEVTGRKLALISPRTRVASLPAAISSPKSSRRTMTPLTRTSMPTSLASAALAGTMTISP